MIELSRVTHRYESGAEALRDVTLHIPDGELVFISGRSGAGKSTLLGILSGDLRATAGNVTVIGHDMNALEPEELPFFRRSIGRLWQDVRLLEDRTVRQNVALPLEVRGVDPAKVRARVDQLLELVGMEDHATTRPHWLSTAEQQKIAVARALVHEPALILADEPTGNLDPDLAYEVVQMLQDVQASGTTVLIATHDRTLPPLFEARVVLLNRGFVVEDGS